MIPGQCSRGSDEARSIWGSIRLGVSENQVVFEFGETTFVTRRIEGSFPNYKQLIPKEPETSVEVVTEELLSAVKESPS